MGKFNFALDSMMLDHMILDRDTVIYLFIYWYLKLRKVAILNIEKENEYINREMLRLQHFYNKSQVVNCYWFKFETNTKITFLP